MPPLLELQRTFYKALLTNDPELVAPLIGDVVDFQTRFKIYRDNVFLSLKEVLHDDFPLCKALLGDKIFNKASFEFVRALPPKHGCLFQYGDEFPVFLNFYCPEYPFIKDVANLEWAKKAARYGPNNFALRPEYLEKIPPQEYVNLRFSFADPSFFLDFSYDLKALSQAFDQKEPAPTPQKRPTYALITRTNGSQTLHWLGADTFFFLKSLFNAAPLEEAWEKTLETYPGFDVSQALAQALINGFFIEKERLHVSSHLSQL